MSWTLVALLFGLFLINGLVAYRHVSAQMRARREAPPPLLRFLFIPRGHQTVAMPRPLRLTLGAVITLGGIALVATMGFVGFTAPIATLKHPIIAVAVIVLVTFVGAGITYVGVRLLQMKHENESLLRPTEKRAV